MINSTVSKEIHEFIRHLLSAVAAASLYTLNHPQVRRLSDAADKSLSFALNERADITLFAVEGELVIDAEPQPFSLVVDRFIEVLKQHSIGHLRFLSGAAKTEIDQLIALLAGQSDPSESGSSEHIRLGKLEISGQDNSTDIFSGEGIIEAGHHQKADSLKDIPALELKRLSDVYEAIKRKERLKISAIASTVSDLVEAFKKEGEGLLLMAALREKDEYTFTHAANVSILTLAQAISLGISGTMLNDIGVAAMLHDVGKMFIPEEILSKPERLNDEEFEQMKLHPVLGARYLMESPGVPKLASIVAFEHHLRYDQSGYPNLTSGWQQNIASQMVAISDCFDAMRTRRTYQEPRETSVIMNAIIMGSGKEFNPLLVKNILQILSRLKKI